MTILTAAAVLGLKVVVLILHVLLVEALANLVLPVGSHLFLAIAVARTIASHISKTACACYN